MENKNTIELTDEELEWLRGYLSEAYVETVVVLRAVEDEETRKGLQERLYRFNSILSKLNNQDGK
jgi:hypothetical protein